MKIEELLGVTKLKEYYGYKYFLEALRYIKRKNIKDKYEINLSKLIYPHLMKKFNTTQTAISSSMIKSLRRMYNEHTEDTRAIYKDLFGSTRRLTPLQFLMECVKYLY